MKLIFVFVFTPDRGLTAHKIEIAVKLELLAATWVMHEVVELASLKLDELVGPDLRFVAIVVGNILIHDFAAARQAYEEPKDDCMQDGNDHELTGED